MTENVFLMQMAIKQTSDITFLNLVKKTNSKVTKKTETHNVFIRDKSHLEVNLDY